MTQYATTDFCACPSCYGDLQSNLEGLKCSGCGMSFAVTEGIPVLLPPYEDDVRQRYQENYHRMAVDDLQQPLETLRDARHSTLLKFMRGLRGKRVLDIGSSNGLYLRSTEAELKVALDLALPYLQVIPSGSRIARVCGDAEHLPFRQGFFDAIVISDVLEHLLEPAKLVERLRSICREDTRIYVHVPWEENLDSYVSDAYEFSHLRSFDSYSFASLWRDFDIRRVKGTVPHMEEPLIFRLQGMIPASIYNRLAAQYFEEPGRAEHDLAWRRSLLAALPRRERLLLRFFRPKYKMFELRLRRPRAEHSTESGARVRVDAASPGQILMLVPHEPSLDPRVMWAADLCASIQPTRVLGTVSSTQKRQREFQGGSFIERVNIAESASQAVQSRARRLGKLLYWRTAVEYTAGNGEAPAGSTLRHRARRQIGAALRFASALGFYRLLDDSLWRRARSSSIKPSVIVCHDIYALPAALRLKSLWGSKVLYDSHEFWPAADLLAQPWERLLTRLWERRLIRKADAVVTVSPPLARCLERTYGLREVISVPNACPRDLSVVPSGDRPLNSPIQVLVQGRVARRRGFEELLDAWRLVDDERVTLQIRCLPDPYLDELMARAHDLVESGRVRLLPPVGEDGLIAAAAQADIGLIPYTAESLNHVFACPNKLSQYMHAGLVVLSNDLPYIASVIHEHGCGLVYSADRPESLRDSIRELLSDLSRLQSMKEAAYRAATQTFNWEVQSRPYRDAIQRMSQEALRP